MNSLTLFLYPSLCTKGKSWFKTFHQIIFIATLRKCKHIATALIITHRGNSDTYTIHAHPNHSCPHPFSSIFLSVCLMFWSLFLIDTHKHKLKHTWCPYEKFAFLSNAFSNATTMEISRIISIGRITIIVDSSNFKACKKLRFILNLKTVKYFIYFIHLLYEKKKGRQRLCCCYCCRRHRTSEFSIL